MDENLEHMLVLEKYGLWMGLLKLTKEIHLFVCNLRMADVMGLIFYDLMALTCAIFTQSMSLQTPSFRIVLKKYVKFLKIQCIFAF